MIPHRPIDILNRTVSAKGCRLSVHQRRAGRIAVLFIHGNFSCKEVFARNCAHCAPRTTAWSYPTYRVTADPPMRPCLPERIVFRDMPRFSGLMERLDYHEYHVVGWSLGGHVGLGMWAQLPRVKSLPISGRPPIESLSLDEAYLDVTENMKGIPLARDVALAIRAKIKEVTGLNASAPR